MRDLLFSISRKDETWFQVSLFDIDSPRVNAFWHYQICLEPETLLRSFNPDYPEQYGQVLGRQLFDPEIGLYVKFNNIVQKYTRTWEPMRLRFLFNVSENDLAFLNSIHWELIVLPNDKTPLIMRSDILFSRCITSDSVIPTKDSGIHTKILAAASNPKLDGWNIDEVDIVKELNLVRQAAQNNQLLVDTIPDINQARCTLKNIYSYLSGNENENMYDVFYLACHGGIGDRGFALFLEKENGNVELVYIEQLIDLLKKLRGGIPRLIILTACHSASSSAANQKAFLALGGRLAKAGVQAVVAMQGEIGQKASQVFMSTLLNLYAKGEDVDCAVAEARKTVAVQKYPDWWRPVLYMIDPTGIIDSQKRKYTFQSRYSQWANTLDSVSTEIRFFSQTSSTLGYNPYIDPAGSRPTGSGRRGTKSTFDPSSAERVRKTPNTDKSTTPIPNPDKPPEPEDLKNNPGQSKTGSDTQPHRASTSSAKPEKLSNDLEKEADVLYKQGETLRNANNFLEAIQCFEQALAIKKRLGDRKGELSTRLEIALTYTYWGNQLLQEGRAQPALDQLQKAADAASPINDLKLKGSILHAIGRTYLSLQDVKSAIGALEQARVIRKTDGDKEALAATCDVLWQVYEQVDNLRMAAERLTTLIAYERTVKSPMLAAHLTMLEQINKRIRAG